MLANPPHTKIQDSGLRVLGRQHAILKLSQQNLNPRAIALAPQIEERKIGVCFEDAGVV
jgi:hypothetical protein